MLQCTEHSINPENFIYDFKKVAKYSSQSWGKMVSAIQWMFIENLKVLRPKKVFQENKRKVLIYVI